MSPEPPRERSDASLRTIGITAAALAALIVIGLLVGWRMARGPSEARAAPLGENGLFQHGAEAQTDVAAAWVRVDARARERLTTYGWVDQAQGVARIPIDQAMRRVAEAGNWNP